MPPKKKAGGGGKRKGKAAAGPPAKLEKQSTLERAMDKMEKSALKDSKKPRIHKIDSHCHISGKVHEDYDCMLNQTNIGHNNNKFYIIQVIEEPNGNFTAWNRWGRVGEKGQNSAKSYHSAEGAIKDFEKKFKDKTQNKWEEREKFAAKSGKYTLLEIDADDEEEEAPQPKAAIGDTSAGLKKVDPRACSLDKATQSLIKLIFDNDMFKEALISMEIDVKKMPLGKLSKMQIVKGFRVLDEIRDCIGNNLGKLTELSNQFYTVVPHDFGRQRPPLINSQEALRKKLDMLITLGDIELTQDLLKRSDQVANEVDGEKPLHPLDANYQLLKCTLTPVTAGDKEFKILETYLEATGQNSWRNLKIINVWRIDREGEADRFKSHKEIKNRKLLWHGTNVAVVAAILKSGLRIMPQSGGRVGKGIYFASENSKSAGYTRPAGHRGIMFLNEVALGNEKHITDDDSSLTKAPNGFDSIVAKGRQEPDPKKDTSITLDGNKVTVPQGEPITFNDFSNSSFSQSEYLVYKESQVRMRYVLELNFKG